MKNKLIIATVFAVLTTSCMSHQATAEQPDNRGVISVSGNATENYQADTVTVTLSVITSAKTVKEATQENNKTAGNVISSIKKVINSSTDTIKTSMYSVYPEYIYDNSKRTNVLTGYKAVNQVTVTSKQINNGSNIIDAAISAGANRVENIDFSKDRNTISCKSVIEKATANAKQNANYALQELGAKITGIKNINVNCDSNIEPRPMRTYLGLAESAGAKAAPTPIEAGDTKIYSNVNIDFFIDK